jgi:hypothetical protein
LFWSKFVSYRENKARQGVFWSKSGHPTKMGKRTFLSHLYLGGSERSFHGFAGPSLYALDELEGRSK